jgi:hypothetical protein
MEAGSEDAPRAGDDLGGTTEQRLFYIDNV